MGRGSKRECIIPSWRTIITSFFLSLPDRQGTISAYETKATSTIVYSGTIDVVAVDGGGEVTITFSTPYTYEGGNLLIGSENTTDSGYKSIYFKGQNVNGASISGYNSSDAAQATANQRNFIPQTTFTYTPGSGTVYAATTGLSVLRLSCLELLRFRLLTLVLTMLRASA